MKINAYNSINSYSKVISDYKSIRRKIMPEESSVQFKELSNTEKRKITSKLMSLFPIANSVNLQHEQRQEFRLSVILLTLQLKPWKLETM